MKALRAFLGVWNAILGPWRATRGGPRVHLGALGDHLGDLGCHLEAKMQSKSKLVDFSMVFCWFGAREFHRKADVEAILGGWEGHCGGLGRPSWGCRKPFWGLGGPLEEVFGSILRLLGIILGILGTILRPKCSPRANLLIFRRSFAGLGLVSFIATQMWKLFGEDGRAIVEVWGGHLRRGAESYFGALEGHLRRSLGPS